jgi:hypothetical protein
MSQLVRKLVDRLNEPRRWTYLVAALPFILAALAGWEMGAAPPYFVVAAFCAAMFFYPTRLGWLLLVLFYLAATAYYAYQLFADTVSLMSGKPPDILLDKSDVIAYLIWIALLAGTLALLLNMKNSRSFGAAQSNESFRR